MINKKAVLLVVDGLGVGELDDVVEFRPQDIGSNTLASIQSLKNFNDTTLSKLNLFSVDSPNDLKYKDFNLKIGKCKLGYAGADSYIGHQQMVGIASSVNDYYIHTIKEEITGILEKNYEVEFLDDLIIIDKHIFIANNMECDPGININVLGMLDEVCFDKILQIGEILRSNLEVSRVIVMGGTPLSHETVFKSIEEKKIPNSTKKFRGISIPKTNIYNENYMVKHLGYKGKDDNLLDILANNNIPITLLGKTANLFEMESALILPEVSTSIVMKKLIKQLETNDGGFFFANAQELDLAGHSEDVLKCARVIEDIEKYISEILSKLRNDDVLIISADHGNDPLIGHPYHTREYVPIIVVGKSIKPGKIKTRNTLSDIGSSICSHLGVENIQLGRSFI